MPFLFINISLVKDSFSIIVFHPPEFFASCKVFRLPSAHFFNEPTAIFFGLEIPSRGSELHNFSPHYPVASPDRGFGSRRLGPRPIFTGFPTQEVNCKLKNLVCLFYFTKCFSVSCVVCFLFLLAYITAHR